MIRAHGDAHGPSVPRRGESAPGGRRRYARELHDARPLHPGGRGGRPGDQPARTPRATGPWPTARAVGLMLDAVRAAVEDCDGAAAGGPAPAGRCLLARIQSLRVANPLSWHYVDPGLLVAEELGIEPAQILVTTTGGNNPQSLVNATALAIGRGELDVAVLAGADCVYTQAAARRHPDRPLLPWTVQPADTPGPTVFGSDRRGTTEAEEERGPRPAHPRVPPVRERPAGRGRPHPARAPGPHRRRCGPGSPRWRRPIPTPGSARPAPAEELITVTESNRMIAYPYTKLLTANLQVDQGAAAHPVLGGGGRGGRRPRGPLGLPAGRGRRRGPLVPLPPARLPLLAGHPAGRGLGPGPGRHRRSTRSTTSTSTRASPRRWRSPPPSSACPTTIPPAPDRHRRAHLRRRARATTTAPTPWPPWSGALRGRPGHHRARHRARLVPVQAQHRALRHRAAHATARRSTPDRLPEGTVGRGRRPASPGPTPRRRWVRSPSAPRTPTPRARSPSRPTRWPSGATAHPSGPWWPVAPPRAGGPGPT